MKACNAPGKTPKKSERSLKLAMQLTSNLGELSADNHIVMQPHCILSPWIQVIPGNILISINTNACCFHIKQRRPGLRHYFFSANVKQQWQGRTKLSYFSSDVYSIVSMQWNCKNQGNLSVWACWLVKFYFWISCKGWVLESKRKLVGEGLRVDETSHKSMHLLHLHKLVFQGQTNSKKKMVCLQCDIQLHIWMWNVGKTCY